MLSALRSRCSVLLRWPRRIAALLCLLLAAVTTGGNRSGAAGGTVPAAVRASTRLPAGQVAVPVPVQAGAARYLKSGDRVSLFTTATPSTDEPPEAASTAPGGSCVGRQLRVLAVPDEGSVGEATVLMVAAGTGTAAAIAAHSGGQFLAVLDDYPERTDRR